MRDAFVLERMAFLMKTWIFTCENGEIHECGEGGELNPLYQSAELRAELMEKADRQAVPLLVKDEFAVYYACIRDGTGYLLVGPMATEYMDPVKRHRFYQKVQVKSDMNRNLAIHQPTEILVFVSTLAKLVTGVAYSDRELVEANGLLLESPEEEELNELKYNLEEDERMDYRHTYQEERQMLDMVRAGNVEEAVKRSKKLDTTVGRLGSTDLDHWRNLLVVSATLCARAAIDGGVPPYQAYRLSGYYIYHGMSCKDVQQLLAYKNHATEKLTALVKERKEKRMSSSYVLQCKDYVRQHFREKLYLEDIAEQLGISPTYLSRLFKQETGQGLQEYILDVRLERAANLLIYSKESISQIAAQVNFPSQSYFGKVFKERMHMTPRQYRERFKPPEVTE